MRPRKATEAPRRHRRRPHVRHESFRAIHQQTRTKLTLVAVLLLLQPDLVATSFVSSARHAHKRLLPLAVGATSASVRPLEKHPLFKESNAQTRRFPLSPHVSKVWEGIIPDADLVASFFGGPQAGRQIRRGVIGSDVSVQFDDPSAGARDLMERCGLSTAKRGDDETLRHLTDVLTYYQDIVSYQALGENANNSERRPCKARIVSTRGPVGTKCPRWHLDHVPLRLIMSLNGPGCVYMPETGGGGSVNRDALNVLDVEDTARANRIIVPNEEGAIHAGVGEVVLLMGREWEEESRTGGGGVLAAAHRSPTLMPFEGRVLLTVDVLPEEY